MTAAPSVLVHHSPGQLAEAVCARLLTSFVDIQSAGQVPRWVLTGGSVADRVHAAIASSAARDAVDWSRVELWWGDERFLPDGHKDRNITQARRALLDHVNVDETRVHPMPAADVMDDPDLAAAAYEQTLKSNASALDHGDTPRFDLVMLGVGPDGHVASLFPEQPALHDERAVVAVRGAPKPPPTRISLTMATLCHSREVWFVVVGAEKAQAVHNALSGAGVLQVPAAGPHGEQRTLWLLDRAAASGLPANLPRHSSP
ncbi:MAG: 6-phosphogluconolactonase [Nocardioidaceae bacterium]|nr:6-phosphogluconolactonase [Nocardioidaceae bacterium]